MKEDVEEDGNGELFLDIADAYMETDHCEEALPILRRCVDSQEYSQVSMLGLLSDVYVQRKITFLMLCAKMTCSPKVKILSLF